jgi:hypothetical protein
MTGLSIVSPGTPDTIWVTIKPGATIYIGSIVCLDFDQLAADEGVIVRGVADGAADTTNKDRPLGIAVGHNRVNPLFSSTYQCEYITDEGVAGPATTTTEYHMPLESAGSKGRDGFKRAMVQIELITPNTILRAPIRNGAIGTAPSLLTSTSSGSKVTMTTNSCDFTTPVEGLGTIYFRTGGNAGLYRLTDDTSATVCTWDVQTVADTAVGDTAVRVPLRPFGQSYVRIGDDTVASFIDCGSDPSTNYDIIHVKELNLEVANEEYVDFMFDLDHFCQVRA